MGNFVIRLEFGLFGVEGGIFISISGLLLSVSSIRFRSVERSSSSVFVVTGSMHFIFLRLFSLF